MAAVFVRNPCRFHKVSAYLKCCHQGLHIALLCFQAYYKESLSTTKGNNVAIMCILRNLPMTHFLGMTVGPHSIDLQCLYIMLPGTPQGSVPRLTLFTLFTHDYSATYPTNMVVKSADDTTIVGLIYQ